MVDIVFLVLLILHIGSIVAWMGGAALFVSVISPSLRSMSPAARGEFVASSMPRYMRFITGSSITAVVAGLALYAYITQVATSLAPSSSGLIYVQAGVVLALIAIIILFAVSMPTARKLAALAKQSGGASGEGAGAQLAALQKRLTMGARLGLALLMLTLILMISGASI